MVRQLFRKQFGALSVKDSTINAPDDGVTDATAAFQAAHDLVLDGGGGVVWMPPTGTAQYLITDTLQWSPLVGIASWKQGGDETSDDNPGVLPEIIFQPTSAKALFEMTAAASDGSYENWGTVSGFKVRGDGTANSLYCCDWLAPSGLNVSGLRVEGFKHAFRLRDQIFCQFENVFVNSANVAGASAFLFDTQSGQVGTTTTLRNCYLRLGDYAVIAKADSHNRCRLIDCLFESHDKGILDLEEGCEYWMCRGCESENVGVDDDANGSLFLIGVNGSGSTGASLNVVDFQFDADGDGVNEGTRVLFEVDRGELKANCGWVNKCGNLVTTTSSTSQVVLRDITIANDDYGIFDWTRGINDASDIVIDNVGWSGFMVRPARGQHAIVEHVTLSGSSTNSTSSVPNRANITGWASKNTSALSITGTLTAAGITGNTMTLYNSLPSSINDIRGRIFVGTVDSPDLGPSAAADDHAAYITTAATPIQFTATSMSGTILMVVYYEYLQQPGTPY